MSPEQVRGEQTDARSDVFSFGTMLYEFTSGRQPFVSESAAATASAILTHEPLPLARFAPEVPDELQRIVRKCLEKDREQRYQSGTFDALELRENGPTVRPPAQQPTVPGSAAAHELPPIGTS